MFKDEDIDLDVQELSERTAKVLTTGHASSCRRLQISQVDVIPLGARTLFNTVCGLQRFLL